MMEQPTATEESPAIEEETSPTALQVDGGRVAPAVGELTRELFAAVRAKNKDRVRELLEMGADVNAYEPADCGTVGCTILCLIIFPIITWLIFPCAILGNTENYKKTPLHVAVTTGDPDMVALLLEFGADRNAPATFWSYCCCEKTPTQFVDIIHKDGEQYGPMKTLLYG